MPCLLALAGSCGGRELCWEPQGPCQVGLASPAAEAGQQLRWLLLLLLQEEKDLFTLPLWASPYKERRRCRCRRLEASLAQPVCGSERNRLSEPCRASPEACCKRWCSTKLRNKEQGTSMMVPPFLFCLSWMWGSCKLEDLKKKERRKWHKIA